jgi:hypothetical protein
MASESADIRAWARAEGYDVPDRGRLSGEVRAAYARHLQPLPQPGEDFDIEEIVPDEPPPAAAPPPPEVPGEISPDPPAAPIGKGRRGRTQGQRQSPAVTRKDIHAKVGVLVYVPGQVWAARDPLCGGTWLNQREPITDALTNLIMQSPDLVAWFSGPAGGFMRVFELLMALQPVALTVWAHHIAHSIGAPEGEPVDARQYAA